MRFNYMSTPKLDRFQPPTYEECAIAQRDDLDRCEECGRKLNYDGECSVCDREDEDES